MTKLATSYLAPQFIAPAPQMFQILSEWGRAVFGLVAIPPDPAAKPARNWNDHRRVSSLSFGSE